VVPEEQEPGDWREEQESFLLSPIQQVTPSLLRSLGRGNGEEGQVPILSHFMSSFGSVGRRENSLNTK
jgi:hypothetical protein